MRLKMTAALTICTTTLASVALGQDPKQPSQPFDFQGFRLGMALREFKAAPLPELPNDPYVAHWRAPLCTGDRSDSFLRPEAQDEDLGVKKCVWAWETKIHPRAEARVEQARVVVADCATRDYSLDFIARPDGSVPPRLFRMQFNLHVRCYDDIAAGLTQKFGKPLSAEQSVAQNRMGASFDNETRIWANEVSSIMLIKRAGSIERMLLVYTLKDHSDFYEERKALERSKSPPKL